LANHIGYLPQNVELLEGTVAENISRFNRSPESESVVAAARAAGIHEMIVSLPDGYERALAVPEVSCLPGSDSGSRWPGRSTATPSSSS
jgi:ABC-type protease/lipase transport system fused ATPase/permease subunit